MTPKTKGLFQRAAILSGPGPSSTSTNQDLSRFRNLAISLGCGTQGDFFLGRTNRIVECMRNVDPQILTNVYMESSATEMINNQNPADGPAAAPPSSKKIIQLFNPIVN